MTAQEKKYRHWSLEQCNKIIEEYKDDTQYFNEEMTFDQMYNMLRLRFEFGEAETRVIIASLIKAGAKFR